MPFKLNKAQTAEWETLLGSLESAEAAFREEIEDLETTLADLIRERIHKLSAKAGEIVTAAEACKTFAEGRAADWRDEHGEKSESWQESEKGSSVDSWISSWESPPELDTSDWGDILRNTAENAVTSVLDNENGLEDPMNLDAGLHEQLLDLATDAAEA